MLRAWKAHRMLLMPKEKAIENVDSFFKLQYVTKIGYQNGLAQGKIAMLYCNKDVHIIISAQKH